MKRQMNKDLDRHSGQVSYADLASLHEKSMELPARRIETFRDLLEEEQRLVMKLKRDKEHMTMGLHTLRQKIEPASELLNAMNKVFGIREKPGLVAHGVDMVMDLFAKKYIFKRSNWLMTLVGSYAVRGISQYILRGKRNGTMGKEDVQGFSARKGQAQGSMGV